MKKYFNFFLSALLVLVFGISLNTCSYAYISRDYIDYTLDISLASADSNFDFFKNSTISQRDSLYVEINQQLDEWNLSKLTDANMITFHFNNSGKAYLYFTFSNCSFPQNYELGFLNIERRYDNYFGSVDGTIYYLSVTQSGNTFAFAPYSITNELRKMRFDFNTVDYNENLTVVTFDGLSVAGLPACYVGYPWENTNTDTYMIVQDSSENGHFNVESDIPDEPDQPSGDTGETGTTGTITNPSGDTTGKVDLSGIEQGIGNINQNLNDIENKIPTSGDIKDSQVQANTDYWGSSGEINPEDFENQLEDNFNGIMENLSGELTQNQIFESLQGAENGFLNFFKEQQNERFYDLAFSWPDIEYMGGVIIPAGGINISEMCREIPELETLRSYIRVIFNFTVAITLIKQIYNLILSTLGIDNPYLYEDYDEVTSINEDTGEYRQTAVRHKKIYNRRR